MGLFNRKEERVYSLSSAMKLLKTEKYAGYTTIPVGNGYKLVPMENASRHIGQYKTRASFEERISGNGCYKNTNVSNYNDYQSARRYNMNYVSER